MPLLQYSQSGGLFTLIGDDLSQTFLGAGWAGKGDCKDKPECQDQIGLGPLPQGSYQVGKSYHHPHLGELAFPLSPSRQNQMFGRSDFFIHGPSSEHFGQESMGCIILMHSVRVVLDGLVTSGINDLVVVE